jgi:hypothetical protein
MTTVYKPKFGILVIISLGIVLIGCFLAMLYDDEWILGLIVTTLAIGILLIGFFTTSYKIDENGLTIINGGRAGKTISIKSIRKIEETYNPLAAPAYTIKRLEIWYGKYDSILIAPRKKKDFIVHLTKLNPDIEVKLRGNKVFEG